MKVLLCSTLLFFTVVLTCAAQRVKQGKSAEFKDEKPGFFVNPIGNGADPWVIKHENFYYVCQASGGADGMRIVVRKSDRLSRLGKAVTVWKAPAEGWNRTQIWAPELHHFHNKWYIYYAAGKAGPPYIHQRSGVLESVTSDPQGAYIDKGVLSTGKDIKDETGAIWAIDVNVGRINGKLYAVWSGWEQNSNTDKTSQHLYMAEMSNPWTIRSERVKISSPDQPWERGGPLDLNEGPQFLTNAGQTFIIYSTRESWTPEYRLGQLRLKDPRKTPLDAANWEKTGPVFQGTPAVFGTGHASFTSSPDGKENWILYHAKKTTAPGWARDWRLQKFTWKADGSPDFGVPVPAGTPVKVPSGELQ
ncbi:glycoside hydrolase family 43 protein [Pedobacter heparinus]|uniref:glycoside hydrolase family 43 protein n=1 Tax=Pedobacter heparinus TaxID=984 RepID=UPI002930A70F|nr:glycoside hydrolase family 43 protein [Pedobacter heparinus]